MTFTIIYTLPVIYLLSQPYSACLAVYDSCFNDDSKSSPFDHIPIFFFFFFNEVLFPTVYECTWYISSLYLLSSTLLKLLMHILIHFFIQCCPICNHIEFIWVFFFSLQMGHFGSSDAPQLCSLEPVGKRS